MSEWGLGFLGDRGDVAMTRNCGIAHRLTGVLLCVLFVFANPTDTHGSGLQQSIDRGEINRLLRPVYTALDNARRWNLVDDEEHRRFRDQLNRWVNAADGEGGGAVGDLSEAQRTELIAAADRIAEQLPVLVERSLEYANVFSRAGVAWDGGFDLNLERLRTECMEMAAQESRDAWRDWLVNGVGGADEVLRRNLEEGGDCFTHMGVFIDDLGSARSALEAQLADLRLRLQETREKCDELAAGEERDGCDAEASRIGAEIVEIEKVVDPPRPQQRVSGGGCGGFWDWWFNTDCPGVFGFALGALELPFVITETVFTGSDEALEEWYKDTFYETEDVTTEWVDGESREVAVRRLGDEETEEPNPQDVADLEAGGYEEVEHRRPRDGGGGRMVRFLRKDDEIVLLWGSRLRFVFSNDNTEVMTNGRRVRSVLDLREMFFEGSIVDGQSVVNAEGERIEINRIDLKGEALGPEGTRLRFSLSEDGVGSRSYVLTVEE